MAHISKHWSTRLPFCYGWLIVAIAFVTMAIGVTGRSRTRSDLSGRRFFTPRLRFKTLDELIAWLLDKCIA
jgi:hypothetical protein